MKQTGPLTEFPKDMTRRNKRVCQEGYQKEMQGAGLNLVDCGSCGSTFIHRTSHEELECPFCDYRSEPCDFPDHFHDGFADSTTKTMTREEKIERYVDAVVQDMDWKTMYLSICDFLYEDLKHESDEEIDQRYNEYFEDND